MLHRDVGMAAWSALAAMLAICLCSAFWILTGWSGGAALLRRRPDIRRSERQLAAATARIGVATAQLYPKVSLGPSATSTGPTNDFLGRDTFAWNLGPLICWSPPNTGAARAPHRRRGRLRPHGAGELRRDGASSAA